MLKIAFLGCIEWCFFSQFRNGLADIKKLVSYVFAFWHLYID
jgi:hypothetical protein